MRGLSKRKGSEVWQGKFRIPQRFWDRRNDLRTLGVKDIGKSQEFTKSLGEHDRDAAAEVYRAKLVAWDQKLDAWQALLDSGPQGLTFQQTVALAGDHAKAFLASHEAEPFDAPPGPIIPASRGVGGGLTEAVGAMSPEERETFRGDLTKFLRASGKLRSGLGFALLKKYPALAADIVPDLAAALETMHGADTDAVLEAKGLHIDDVSRRILNLEMLDRMGAAQRGLEQRRTGDYGEVDGLKDLPGFQTQTLLSTKEDQSGVLTLSALLDHKAKTQGAKDKTVRVDRSYLEKFTTFAGHSDSRKVTKDEVRGWRDSLIVSGLTPKTINDKYLSALRSVLSHGVVEFDLSTNAASGIRDKRVGPAPMGSKGYSETQAVAILKATFKGSTKALSLPHRRALFWVPWVLAYTGLRVSEITQFRGCNLMEEEGRPFLFITPDDGSTKSGKAWTVGIHQHLIDLGFTDMLRKIGEGPAFYEPYPKGANLKALGATHRAQDAGVRVSHWITKELGIVAPNGRPNHAWRHLFTTRSRSCGMDKEARDYMMGSRSGTDARESYGDWPPTVTDAEINRLPRFDVKDTGWRPQI